MAVVSIEVYLFSYIPITNLQTVNPKNAEDFAPWFNGTYTFSSDGGKWLILFQLGSQPSGTSSFAMFYIFKLAQNLSLGIMNINLVPQKFWVTTTSNEGVLNDNPNFFSYGSPNSYRAINNNCTFAFLEYTAFSGSHNVDYAFTFRVYETTLAGIFPLNEATAHFNATITIP